MTLRKRIFDIIQIGNKKDVVSRWFDYILVTVIVLNISVLFLDTFDELNAYDPLFKTIETVTVLFFCVEYVLRIWTADYLYPDESHTGAIRRFLFSFDGIVDLLTILPFFFLSGFVVFRMMRIVRIFHLFRINTNYDSFHVIRSVLYEKRNQLASSIFIIFVLIMASSLFMYSVEHPVQPDKFKNAFSGIWWSVSTLLTVGYGDIYPITTLGQIMAIIIAILGVGVVAIPTGIISAGFVEQYTKMSQSGQEISLHTVIIDVDSQWLGKTFTQLEEEYGVDVVLAKRGDKTTIPIHNEQFHIQTKDALYVYDTKT
ncbi:MAG: ion transporter, partial [Erysipelotrichaceae bacterium]|nr:ion transporter [Erysipelotrichaceae bacterium]